jgi:hypothetical protein
LEHETLSKNPTLDMVTGEKKRETKKKKRHYGQSTLEDKSLLAQEKNTHFD